MPIFASVPPVRLSVYLSIAVSVLTAGAFTLRRLEDLKAVLRDREKEVLRLSALVDEKSVQNTELVEANTELRQENAKLAQELVEKNTELAEKTANLVKKTKDLHEETARTGRVEEAMADLQASYSHTVELLEVRSTELNRHQGRQTNTGPSEADVVRMVQELNLEILETATIMGDAFTFSDSQKHVGETANVAAAAERVEELLGARMAELLKTSSHQDDAMLVQVAFQSCMSAWAEWMITTWSFEESEGETMLAEIHDNLREAEQQAVSGPWRSLARRYTHQKYTSPSSLTAYFIDSFVDVLLVSGCEERGNMDQLRQGIAHNFSTVLTQIVERTLALNKTAGQDIVECEIEAVYVGHGVKFDSASMEEAFERDSSPTVPKGAHDLDSELILGGERILCATELGLARAVKMGGQWSTTMLLKPKVVLESALEEVVMDYASNGHSSGTSSTLV